MLTRTISTQAAPSDLWVRAAEGQGPRYLRIVDFIERAMTDGRLRPGDRLPPQRQLARLLGLDLTTVTRAYAEARARQLVQARGAYGTFVAAPKVELAPVVDLSMNIPPPPAELDLARLLKRGVEQVLTRTDASALMTYQTSGGNQADRAAGAIWLAPMLGKVPATRIATSPGAQAALSALILALTRPGDGVAMEPLVYPGLLDAVRGLDRRAVVLDIDDEGLLPDALARACRERGVRVVYLNPTLQNPTTRTMPASRRRDIVRVAADCDIQIVEDDPCWRLADKAPAPLAKLDSERVHYVASLSKCLAPGLRTAYVVSPDAVMQERFLAAMRVSTLMPAPLMAALSTQWLHDGTAMQVLDGVKTEARERQRLAMSVLARREQTWPDAGIHVWYALPEQWTAAALVLAARAEGLAVTASDVFAANGTTEQAVRLSLGGVKERIQLAQGLQRLAVILERGKQTTG